MIILKLSRPEKLNSLNTKLLRSLESPLKSLCNNSEVSVIAIREGKLFSAGIDLEEVANALKPSDSSLPFKALADVINVMLPCEKVTASILNGPAVAGGAELALSSDIVIATKSSWIQWPEISSCVHLSPSFVTLTLSSLYSPQR